MVQLFNSKVKQRAFMVGDMVLCRANLKKGNAGPCKLICNWEGPFQVTKVIMPEAYKLAYLKEKAIPRSWNIANLKKFYQ